jgi:hypothetical protein
MLNWLFLFLFLFQTSVSPRLRLHSHPSLACRLPFITLPLHLPFVFSYVVCPSTPRYVHALFHVDQSEYYEVVPPHSFRQPFQLGQI